MATITITLPDAAVAHAEDCAKQLGFDSTANWILEWLLNSVKMVEKQRNQKAVSKLEKQIETQVDALYSDGVISATPVIDVPVVTTPKVV